MFLVFGSPRSGTTLFATTLDLNDDIVIPREADFIIPIAFIIDRVTDQKAGKELVVRLIVSANAFKPSIGEYLSEREVKRIVKKSDYSVSSILNEIYGAIAVKAEAKIAGNKSPNDLLFARILIKMGLYESDIKIIHLIRDIRDVLLSLKRVKWEKIGDIEKWFPRLWSASNLYIHNLYKSNPEKYLLVKYEDAVLNPFETFRRVTDFLEVPFQEKMFEHNRRGGKYEGHVDHKNLSSPFLTSRVGGWKDAMDRDLENICTEQAYDALREFGYLQ